MPAEKLPTATNGPVQKPADDGLPGTSETPSDPRGTARRKWDAATIAGLTALNVSETLILLLVEMNLIPPDRMLCALEDLVHFHTESASRDDENKREMHAAIADNINNLIRGTNLYAAQEKRLTPEDPTNFRN